VVRCHAEVACRLSDGCLSPPLRSAGSWIDRGHRTDASGAAIAKVEIQVRNLGTNLELTTFDGQQQRPDKQEPPAAANGTIGFFVDLLNLPYE
jgi:hypothetical protein